MLVEVGVAGRALRNGSINMDVLVALGTTASYVYSIGALLYGALTGFWSPRYIETSAMLITFVLLGKYLECLAKGKTSDAIKKLVELTLATALMVVKDKGVGANNGVLIKGGDSLERAQMVMYVILDKKGTLTRGKATVTSAKVFTRMDRGEFLTLVASAEVTCNLLLMASSEHPLAKAILQYARHFHFFDDSSPTSGTQNDAKEVRNRKLLAESGINISIEVEIFVIELEEIAKTGILVAYDDVLTSVLGVASFCCYRGPQENGNHTCYGYRR
ncbi:hypothetical protein RJT34_26541 [Clitoria ternatea]|uniref:Uncharacterized protein n=1 Tax=Clitoria ternatea TaxID=43366 RepID=A0AAN9I835_CLITE